MHVSLRAGTTRRLAVLGCLAAMGLLAGCGSSDASTQGTPVPTALAAGSATAGTRSSTPVILPTSTPAPTYAVPKGTPIPAGKLAMRVNGRPVPLQDLARLREQYMRKLYERDHIDPASKNGRARLAAQMGTIREYLIYREIMKAYAEGHGLVVTDKQLQQARQVAGGDQAFRSSLEAQHQTLQDYKDQITLQNAQLSVITKHSFIAEEVRIRQIVFSTLAQAREVRTKLLAGADWTKMAQQYSIDLNSRSYGGDIGYFARGTYDPAYEKAAFSLEVNGISQPLKIGSNYYLLQLLQRVKNAKLQGTSLQKAQQRYFDTWYLGQRKAAKVETLA